MKKLLTLLPLLATSLLYSQNLVINPSFENHSQCPNTHSQLPYAVNWQNPPSCLYNTADYYHSCSPTDRGVPTNIVGSQAAYDGSAYAGIYSFGINSYVREYMLGQLISPLVAGQTYTVSFQCSLADQFGTAIGTLGAYLSAAPIPCVGQQNVFNNYTPQVEGTTILASHTDWGQVSGTFTASGGEQYITIGNFRTDAMTPSVYAYPGAGGNTQDIVAYYYIDMVSVTATLANDQFTNAAITISPNPFENAIHIHYPNKQTADYMEVYSASGQLLHKTQGITDEIYLGSLVKGVYFIQIVTQDSGKFIKKLVKI